MGGVREGTQGLLWPCLVDLKMEFIDALSGGFSSLSTLPIALALIIGAALGIVVGVLPGVGPGVTIAVLLPFTYGMAPLGGISLVLGV